MLDILAILGIRFLLFDYFLFKPCRDYLSKFAFFALLFRCPYCQGFEVGFLYGLVTFQNPLVLGFASAIASLTWFVYTDGELEKLEIRSSSSHFSSSASEKQP